ncbi:MAG TPA: thioredoxin domain-containing protein [Gemmatimonadaceae bacterium]|nr:thioredoxin domain-containing protein [Gemmatimonadaceae bacterium]
MPTCRVNFSAALAAAFFSVACNPANSATRSDAPATSGTGKTEAAKSPPREPADPSVAAADRGRIGGDSSARAWVIIASDFQCPFCKQWHDETYKPFIDQYVRTGKVRVAYIHFPLNQHQNAVVTAEASMCAAAQNRFWEYHDALFDTQLQWAKMPDPRALLDSIAQAVGVKAGDFRECLNSHRMQPLVMADRDRASAAGVGSTPSFLIGDQVLAGAQPLDEMRPAIDAAIAKSASAGSR